MKQIPKTPYITDALRQSVGPDVNLDGLAVYESIAFNNRPVRKNHPLFKGAIADRSMLLDMASALSLESRPLRVEHSVDGTPTGRAFHGAVVDKGSESELRVLFFVPLTDTNTIEKLDSGTVDQVSVSVLPKKMLNSKSGFDYLGPDAKPENIWTGKDNDGNQIGVDGIHAKMVGLDKWFELSLVGMGGAENARILSKGESYFGSSYQKLAASGVDPNIFLLEASVENEDMDLKELVDKVTSLSADLTTANLGVTTKDAEIVTLKASVADLTTKLEAADKPNEALTTAQAQVTALTASGETLKADNEAAIVALQEVAKTILAASGKVNETVPSTVAELTALITASKTTLAAALVAGGVSNAADKDKEAAIPLSFGAYRRATK